MPRLLLLLTLAVFWLPKVNALTELDFTIPSGATSEASRLYAKLIKQFEASHPDIDIRLEPYTNWDEVTREVKSMTAKGQSAGLFVSEVSTTLELIKANAVIPFEVAIKSLGQSEFGSLAEFKGSFVSTTMLENSYSQDGVLYGPPFIRSTPIAFYNLDLLDQIGYGKQNLPQTWAEMKKMLELYYGRTGKAPFGLGGVWYDYLFEAMVRQAGGALMKDNYRVVTFNSPEAITALEYWQDLINKKLLKKTLSWKSTINAFVLLQRYPVIFYSSGGLGTAISEAKFNWVATVMPKMKRHGVSFGGGNLYLSAHMTQPEIKVALKFSRFLWSSESQGKISEATGFFPVTRLAFDAIENPRLKPLKSQFKNNQVFGKIMTVKYLKTRDLLKQAIDQALYEGVSAQEALNNAQLKVEQLLSE